MGRGNYRGSVAGGGGDKQYFIFGLILVLKLYLVRYV